MTKIPSLRWTHNALLQTMIVGRGVSMKKQEANNEEVSKTVNLIQHKRYMMSFVSFGLRSPF